MAFTGYYQPQMMNPVVPNVPQRYSADMFTPQYQQNFQQPQQLQQQIQSTLPGRIIDDITTVTVNEVPMNGDVALFMKRDLSEIYAKRWGQNGIENAVYKLVVENTSEKKAKTWEESLKELSDSFQLELMNINEKLDKALETKTTTSARGGGSK